MPAVYVRKIQIVQAVIPGNVRVKTGVRTENVHWRRKLDMVMRVTKIDIAISYFP